MTEREAPTARVAGWSDGGGRSPTRGLSPISAARVRHPLSDVAARTGVALGRTTGSVTVHCPLPAHGHFDRSPSMRLHLDDGIFHCFGCGQKGDVVEWARQTEGVAWREAIQILDSGARLRNTWSGSRASGRPDRTGPGHGRPARPLAPECPDLRRTPPARVFAALDAAWRYYSEPALHEQGVRYLAGRGIPVSILERLVGRAEVGHTPAHARGLACALLGKGFTSDELTDAGLISRGPDGLITDFYRQRMVVPVRDDAGRVCGLVGRSVAGGSSPKYKNPPRTLAYDKSVNLYQPLPAPRCGTRGRVVVVEGTLDAMAIAVMAIASGKTEEFCPITQSGHDLSPSQLAHALALHASPPVVAFDGDRAGREASRRLWHAAALAGCDVVVATLPDGEDPASWLASRGEQGLAALRHGRRPDYASPSPQSTSGMSPDHWYVRPTSGLSSASTTELRASVVRN